MATIVQPVKPPRTEDIRETTEWMRIISERLGYLQSTGSPAGSVVPRWVGDRYFDTSNTEWYLSTGLTSADWEVAT